MKTLITTTFTIALMAFGFASITATPAQATSNEDKCQLLNDQEACRRHLEERTGQRIHDVNASLDDDRHEDCNMKENPDGLKLCFKPDENGVERVAGVELPAFCDDPENAADAICRLQDWKGGEVEGEVFACIAGRCWSLKHGETEGGEVADFDEYEEDDLHQQIACSGTDYIYGCRPTKTPTGTFYPLPMIDVASMDKLLAPGGTSVASFDKILAPGGTAVESDYQFADREDGSGGDFGEAGGSDFGEGDRAAASTAAE